MSKTALGVRYNQEWFVSKYVERDEEEMSILKEICEEVTKGNKDFIKIIGEGGYTYYVSRKILERSIISIIEESGK